MCVCVCGLFGPITSGQMVMWWQFGAANVSFHRILVKHLI